MASLYAALKRPDRVAYTQSFCDEMEHVIEAPLFAQWPRTMLTTVERASEAPNAAIAPTDARAPVSHGRSQLCCDPVPASNTRPTSAAPRIFIRTNTDGDSYNGEIASDVEDHGVTGRLNWRF